MLHFPEKFINILNVFKQQIIDGYAQKSMRNKLINILKNLTERSRRENTENISTTNAITPITPVAVTENDDGKRFPRRFKTSIDFELNENLIYYFGDVKRRLCLLSSMEKNVFHLTHDENMHAGVHRSFNRIPKSLYSPLSKKLRRYIEHYPNYQFTQTKKHKPYGELMPIIFPFQSFHIITIVFIFVLLGELNSLFNVTDKFIRKIAFMPGKFTYDINQWVNALLDRLIITNWGIPAVIISDRDPKFLFEIWQIFFQRMGIKQFTFIVYHPQTDGISKCTNQTVEITILITNYPDINFVLTYYVFL